MAQWAEQTPLSWIGGKPVFCFRGAEGDGDGNQGGNNSNGGQGGQGAQSGANGGQGGNGQSAGADTISKADYDALMARMQAADKNKAAAEARVAELEGASKTELEKAQAALAEANKKVEALTQGQQAMLVSNAFLTVKDAPNWHNSQAALALLDKSLVTVEDDGNVKGMEAAVAKLKTDHPYLIKTDAGNGDGQQQGGGQQQNGGNGNNSGNGGGRRSGSSNNGAGGGGKTPDRKELERRFPALRGRGL